MARRSIFRHSFRPSAEATFTSLPGSMRSMAFTTAPATPPVTAKPRPAPVASLRGTSSSGGMEAKPTPLASNMPWSSSKVSTKSTSERMVRRLASSFLAAQGPMKAMRHPGSFCFCRRAVSTMGVRAMEI